MEMDRTEDKHLVKKLLAGDKKALRQWYNRYYPRLLAHISAKVKTKEDAEELTQDVFLSSLDALPLFGFRSSLYTFMVSIARHEIADYFRKFYAKKAIKYVPFVDQVYTEPLYSAEETRELFIAALAKLSPKEQQLIEWKYEQNLSVEEIARKLDVGIKAAESRLFRARSSFIKEYTGLSIAYPPSL